MNLTTGGRAVIDRLMEIYGFRTRQALCERMGVSKSTMATRYMRDLFPSDWVVQAAIETGANVQWLAFGLGEKFSNVNTSVISVPSWVLVDGKVINAPDFYIDKSLVSSSITAPKILSIGNDRYLIESNVNDYSDGLWVVTIDGITSLREIMRLPMQQVRVSSTSGSFDCPAEALTFNGKVHLVMRKDAV